VTTAEQAWPARSASDSAQLNSGPGVYPAAAVRRLASLRRQRFASTMPWQPYPPLPRETVRDLLGITRALYRATLASDPRDVVRLQALADIGKDFRNALADSRGSYPGTLKHIEAWVAAERAMKALGALIGEDVLLAPIVRAVADRVRRDG
jgi:hypothetical protein